MCKKSATAKTDRGSRSIMKTLVDGGQEACPDSQFYQVIPSDAGQQFGGSIISCFRSLGDPTPHETFENEFLDQFRFPGCRRAKKGCDLRHSTDCMSLDCPPKQKWNIGVMGINVAQ